MRIITDTKACIFIQWMKRQVDPDCPIFQPRARISMVNEQPIYFLVVPARYRNEGGIQFCWDHPLVTQVPDSRLLPRERGTWGLFDEEPDFIRKGIGLWFVFPINTRTGQLIEGVNLGLFNS